MVRRPYYGGSNAPPGWSYRYRCMTCGRWRSSDPQWQECECWSCRRCGELQRADEEDVQGYCRRCVRDLERLREDEHAEPDE